MKKFLLLILITACLNSFGQANMYHPFPMVYGDWGGFETIYPSMPGGGQPQQFKFIYYTSGDTIINANSYKKMNYINDGLFMGVLKPLNQIFTGGSYSFSYRNDSLNKKVYIVPFDSIQETLWYDFNLHIGDTLKKSYSLGGAFGQYSGLVLKVDSIDSMQVCNNYYKRFYINCGNPTPYSRISLTEGKGFSSNFISASFSDDCYSEPIHIYSTGAWSLDACPNGLGIQNNSTLLKLINIYPNPARNNFTIETATTNKQTLQLFDVTGKLVLNQTIEGKTTIDVNSLNEGVYNLSLVNTTGVINKRLVIMK